jgi:CelD/BcsL family acetyltransferase involved in cellulose biosynthesis
MVDIHAAKVSGATLADGHQGRVAVDIRPADDIALADYDQFCASAVYGVGQNPVWVRAWIEATGCDALIVSVRRAGRQIVALALEVVREGPFRIARYPGGDHANGNFPAVARDGAKLSEDDAKAICEAIHDARPDIDLVYLQRQNPRHSATENALVELSSVQSPNVSLAVDLSGGFDGVMTRRHGKKKRKKYRLQVRKFEDLGGYRIITPGGGSADRCFLRHEGRAFCRQRHSQRLWPDRGADVLSQPVHRGFGSQGTTLSATRRRGEWRIGGDQWLQHSGP